MTRADAVAGAYADEDDVQTAGDPALVRGGRHAGAAPQPHQHGHRQHGVRERRAGPPRHPLQAVRGGVLQTDGDEAARGHQRCSQRRHPQVPRGAYNS